MVYCISLESVRVVEIKEEPKGAFLCPKGRIRRRKHEFSVVSRAYDESQTSDAVRYEINRFGN